MAKIPNGAFRSITSAARSCVTSKDYNGKPFVVYHCEYGYGWVVIGSAAHDDLLKGFMSDGLGDTWPAKIVEVYE